jgi:hypothetical protein
MDQAERRLCFKTPASLCIETCAWGKTTFGTTVAYLRLTLDPVASHPIPFSPHVEVTAANFFSREAMNNTEKFEDHHEGWRTLWLAVAGVMAITLTWNALMLSLNGISY